MSLLTLFIYKINSNDGASNTQEDSQKLKTDTIKYFTSLLFLSAKPMERYLKFWQHISQTGHKIICSIFIWATIYSFSLKIEPQFFMCTYYLI